MADVAQRLIENSGEYLLPKPFGYYTELLAVTRAEHVRRTQEFWQDMKTYMSPNFLSEEQCELVAAEAASQAVRGCKYSQFTEFRRLCRFLSAMHSTSA